MTKHTSNIHHSNNRCHCLSNCGQIEVTNQFVSQIISSLLQIYYINIGFYTKQGMKAAFFVPNLRLKKWRKTTNNFYYILSNILFTYFLHTFYYILFTYLDELIIDNEVKFMYNNVATIKKERNVCS